MRQMPVVAIGAAMVVAVFAAEDLSGVTKSGLTRSTAPIACAVGKFQAGGPGRLVDVTITGVAEPTRAAVAYSEMLMDVM